ncbi:amino acid transporter [Viridothelium virens]|uniref:Amino acid transporter n=1 Tax=Viridothelium virens TaxID=1048519 RepID=A0A6A6HFV5_VIRVR|nr:amino acid transporter [Viridothelium virens]
MTNRTPNSNPIEACKSVQYSEEWPLAVRIGNNTSKVDGHLEDQNLDIDARTLALLGKRQRLSRNFGLVSIVAFSTTLQAAWASVAVTFQVGMVSGGPVNLFYGLIFCWIGAMAIAASLAELTSMAPTAGAQYHWVSLLAPVRFATIFSWVAGWITVFARMSLYASASFIVAQLIQGIAVLNHDSYEPAAWQGTLIYWTILLITTTVNILGIRKFPHIETIAFVFFVAAFFVVLVPLVYLTPQSTATFVFTDFENSSGWSNDGLVWFIGLMNAAYTFVGIDGTSHMSEEVMGANVVVPRSMVWSQFINGGLGIAMTIVILFGIGDIAATLSTKTKYPIIQMLLGATQSKGATTVMTSFIAIIIFFAALGILASASRLTWAFARDNGLPFPKFFAHVNKAYLIPVRALVLVVFVAVLLGLINIGSMTAFQAFISLSLIGLYTSYFLPIILLVSRRFGQKEVPFGPWTLGRWGLAINCVALVYITIIATFIVFPPYQPVSWDQMNYAGPIFGLSLLLCLTLWLIYGRRIFIGPVHEVLEDRHIKS